MKLYLNARRKGLIDRRIRREEITDESPLIRDHQFRRPRQIREKQIRKIIHRLYSKAGLLKSTPGKRYDLCAHSLRRYFKTQMEALGVNSDYTEYMMGHTVGIYMTSSRRAWNS